MRFKFNAKKYCTPTPKAFYLNGVRLFDGINNVRDCYCTGHVWDSLTEKEIIEILESHPEAPEPRSKEVARKPLTNKPVDLATEVKQKSEEEQLAERQAKRATKKAPKKESKVNDVVSAPETALEGEEKPKTTKRTRRTKKASETPLNGAKE